MREVMPQPQSRCLSVTIVYCEGDTAVQGQVDFALEKLYEEDGVETDGWSFPLSLTALPPTRKVIREMKGDLIIVCDPAHERGRELLRKWVAPMLAKKSGRIVMVSHEEAAWEPTIVCCPPVQDRLRGMLHYHTKVGRI